MFLGVQGGLDHRVSGAIITASECAALLAAFVIVLSMLGVNVNALLLPAGVALAFAAKDLSHNFLAGGALLGSLSASKPQKKVNVFRWLIVGLFFAMQDSSCLQCSPSSWATGWL